MFNRRSLLLIALAACSPFLSSADEEVAKEVDNSVVDYTPSMGASYEFLETFQDGVAISEKKWVLSDKEKYAEQVWVQEIEYNPEKPTGIPGDFSLILNKPHKHYGIVRYTDEMVSVEGQDLVIQYEVRAHDGITCSGAYLKLLRVSEDFVPSQMDENSPYSIMFGPDKCGSTNKVHVIIQQHNPVTGEWEEKHMTTKVSMPLDGLSHLYTLELKQDDTYAVYIDSVQQAAGSLLGETDFTPPFQVPEFIDDPEDKKPEDWVDEEKIADPEASKPEDWDEDAPKMIEDLSVEKPDGWLDDAPLEIEDPSATEPEDWDEEDDGVWAAPLIKNPACSVGCGEWVRPTIENPEYKGKWSVPMIANPAYIGKWAPAQIANPAYFKVERPIDSIAPIGAVAIEVLANDKGIGFDNILIGHDLAGARSFAKETHALKMQNEKLNKEKAKRDALRKTREEALENGGFPGMFQYYMGEANEVVYQYPLQVATAVLMCVSALFFFKASGGEAVKETEDDEALKHYKKTDEKKEEAVEDEEEEGEEDENEEEEDEEEEEEEEEKPTTRRRRSRRAD